MEDQSDTLDKSTIPFAANAVWCNMPFPCLINPNRTWVLAYACLYDDTKLDTNFSVDGIEKYFRDSFLGELLLFHFLASNFVTFSSEIVTVNVNVPWKQWRWNTLL